MPEKETMEKAIRDKQEGKSPSTQAGEFVHEEIDKIRKGEHGARSTKQAIAIGLNEARRAGVKLKPPKAGTVSEKTRMSAKYASEAAKKHKPVSRKRSMARKKALKKESTQVASHSALSKQARQSARRRSAANRSAAAKKGVKTKGHRTLSNAAKKAARTRTKHKV